MNQHVEAVARALGQSEAQWRIAEQWGRRLAEILPGGARLLAAGNGGSAAQVQHLTAELVGRYQSDRRPLSAIALHAETSALTAIMNDYGIEDVFARQVWAHGRPGDICLFMSTSGHSPNVVSAAKAARECGLTVWAMTGRAPNPLVELSDDALCIDAADTCTVQELHLIALHIVCEAMDAALEEAERTALDEVLTQVRAL